MKRTPFLLVVLALASAALLRATVGLGLQAQLGNPSGATANPANHQRYLIERAQYSLDYSDELREPNWVSWNLTSTDVGSAGRSPDFFVDTTLPAGFTAVLTSDYSGSGYDRGHMCPSGDRTLSRADNDFTFYMSNMVPQAPDNNQGVWANFESYCRSLASAGNEVLIISGPGGFAGSTIATGVAIPGHVWKIAVVVPLGPGTAVSRITAATRVIAIKIPNVQGVRSDPWQNYLTSAAQLEADTGYTFFTELPGAIAAALRVKVDGQTATGAPVIVTPPVAQTAVVGGSVTFAVTATGDAPLAYQWFKDDAEIAGATTSSLTLNNVQAASLGNYFVVVTNGVGSATSAPAALVITGLPPVITGQPQAVSAAAGSTVALAVTAAGSPPLSYQWRKAGSDLPGATLANLTLANLQATDIATYDVVVTNPVSSVTSNGALVSVVPAAPSIVTHPATQTVTGGTVVTLSVVARGTQPFTYAWRKGGTPLVDGGVISGATAATLTLTGVTAADSGSYDVVVTNSVGNTTSNPATLTVNAATIVWNFGTAAPGTADPTSGLPIDITGGTVSQGNNNGTTTMLTTSSASSSYTGASASYNAGAAARVGVLNKAAGGSAYFEFTLTPDIGKKLVITNVAFGARSTSTGPQAYSIFTSFDGYTTPVASGTLLNNSNWALITPASFAAVTGTTGAPVTVRIYGHNGTGSPGINTANWRIDDLKVSASTLVASAATAPTVVATTPANGAVGIAVSTPITVTFNQPVQFAGSWFTITSALQGPMAATVTGGPTTYTLTPPVSYAFGDSITVKILAGHVIEKDTGTVPLAADHTFTFGTGLPIAPTITQQPLARTVVDGAAVSFTVAASGTAPLTYQWRKGGNPISGNPSAASATLALAAVTPLDAGSYDCVVTNAAGSATSDPAALTVTLTPPTIVTQPVAQTVTVGGTAVFAVTASGSAPLSYVWRRGGQPLSDGAGVSGATTASLSLSGVSAANIGTYDVVVTNAAGFATSQPANLGVTTATLGAIAWDFTTTTPTSGLPATLTGGLVSQGNNNGTTTLLTSVSVSSGYTGATGTFNAGLAARIGPLSQAAGGSAYFEFTLTPAAGYQLVATALQFGSRSTGTGPQAYAVVTSVDGYAQPVAGGTMLANSSWSLKTPAFAGVRGVPGQAVTFRIYGYNGTGSPGINTANWRIDDLRLTAGAELVPLVASTSPVAGATGVLRTSSITVTFNQPVAVSGAWFTITSALHGPLAATVSGGPTTFTLTPNAAWDYSDTITTRVVAANVKDQAGTIGMPADASFSFATELPVPPTVTLQPVATTATVGDQVTLTVAATGTAPLTYQWRKGGTALVGNPTATTPSLVLTGITTADAGSYDVIVSNLAGSVPSDPAVLTVNKATATVTLAGLTAVYDGLAKAATATTSPAGLTVQFTYNGSPTPPVNAGAYAVVATVVDANYQGSATGSLNISPAPATVTLGGLTATYDGSPKPVTVTTSPAGLPVAVTYNGSSSAPANAGSYGVSAVVSNPNYVGAASGTLVIQKATATIALSGLQQTYTGTPRVVTATTVPSGLDVILTYGSSTAAPVGPGSFPVVATVNDANYTGSATGTLVISTTVLVRHAPVLNGEIDGSVQVNLPESITLNGSALIAGDLLVPGTPDMRLNGKPTFVGVKDGPGSAMPTGHIVTLGGSAVLRYLVQHTDAVPLPVVSAPPAPTGTRNVVINSANQSPGDFVTLRNLTLNGNAGAVAVPPGTYGAFIANANSTLVLGVAGATQPAVYQLQSLTLNGGGRIEVVGPVEIQLATGASLGGVVGSAAHADWLKLRIAAGGLTLNGGAAFHGQIVAPNGTVVINGNALLRGGAIADRLTINGGGTLEEVLP
ncbi:MAG: immunoglobulin domain-containing protein [Verrucomicrobia bacterium]|nr:immunoglobulin domain-containing protein [Verrucomicrobiota bacterium]